MASKVAGYRAEGYRRFQLKVGGVGIAMTLEDSWGGDIATAAIAHLAQSTPPEWLFTTTDFNSYITVSTAAGAQMSERPHDRIEVPGPWHPTKA